MQRRLDELRQAMRMTELLFCLCLLSGEVQLVMFLTAELWSKLKS